MRERGIKTFFVELLVPVLAALLLAGCGGESQTQEETSAEELTAPTEKTDIIEKTTAEKTTARAKTTAAEATISPGPTGGETTAQPKTTAGAPPIFPDASLHAGATNPDVTQDNLDSTICKSGFTKTIRPPASYTNKLEQQQIRDEGLPGSPQDYEEDHLISLELGGAPKDEKNLWPQPYENRGAKFVASGTGSESKDKIENETKRLVCSGKMSLSDAQKRIASDWRKLGTDEGVL